MNLVIVDLVAMRLLISTIVIILGCRAMIVALKIVSCLLWSSIEIFLLGVVNVFLILHFYLIFVRYIDWPLLDSSCKNLFWTTSYSGRKTAGVLCFVHLWHYIWHLINFNTSSVE